MKLTPYIYILVYFVFLQTANSQNSKTIKLTGSNKNETAILKQLSFKRTITSDSSYNKQLISIEKKLDSIGFTDHQIESISKNDSVFQVKIILHQLIKEVIVQNPENNLYSFFFKLKKFDDNKLRIPFYQINDFLENLVKYYQNNGFPFVKVKLTHFKKEGNLLFTSLLVNKSDKRTINKIIIKGYANFPKSFIKYELNINPNEIFDKNKIIQTSKRIQNLVFVDEIKKPEILFKKDSTNLYLYLKKNKSNQFDGLIGFSSNEQKGININGHLNLKLLNILNYGENFELKWLSDGKQSQNLKLQLETPYLFKSPFSSQYNFNIFKKDSSFITISHFLNIDYNLIGNQKLGFIISNKTSNTIHTTLLNPNIIDFTTILYGVSYNYIKPYNHTIFKTKFRLESSFLQGKRNKNNQSLISNVITMLFPLNPNNNLSLTNRSQLLLSDSYLANELFRIGGSNSIRGFDEESIFSNKYSYFNIDYNHIVNSTTFLSVFADIGYIENSLESQNYATYSFGLGYSNKTPIGLLGIQYSIGNTTNNYFSFNNSKLHLKFSQFF